MNSGTLGQVTFIHPRFGRDGTPVKELLAKFDVYGKSLSASSNGEIKQLTLLAGIKKPELESINQKSFPFVNIIRISDPTNNFLIFALKTWVVFRRGKFTAGLVVAGDFWVGGLSTYVLVKLCRARTKTQLTLHGNPVGNLGRGFSLRNSLRRLLFRFLLHKFDSIRLVSNNLLSLLEFDSENLFRKVLVSPVYMPVIQSSHVGVRRSKSIMIMGRLHHERNTLEALSAIRTILKSDRDLRVNLVGNGSMQEEVLQFCERELTKSSFIFWGWLPHEEAINVLATCTVLISSAPEEGYGQAIREALTLGIPVVARRNTETLGLSLSWPRIISTYETEKDATRLVRAYLNAPPQDSEFSDFRSDLELKNEASLKTLTHAWVELASRQT